MARKLIISPGEFYHVYNRGTDKRSIFMDKTDYARFIQLLYLCNNTSPIHINNLNNINPFYVKRKGVLISIGSYCLIENHLHLFLFEKNQGGISQFMHKLGTAYTMYFNKRHGRTGSLFEGSFRCKHLDNDPYLKYIFSYIHLNPASHIQTNSKNKRRNSNKVWDYISKYKYSSLPDYLGVERLENKILDRSDFPDYFSSPNEIKKEIFNWLTYPDDTDTEA